jgi:hypothetical protein
MQPAFVVEQSSAVALATELMDRLRDLVLGIAQHERTSDAGARPSENAMRVAHEPDLQRREPGRDPPARRNSGERADNPIDQAAPLSGYGERQAGRGQGQGDRPEGSNNAEGGAMGMHIVSTNAGEGGVPHGVEDGQSGGHEGSDSVLGEQTTRLAAQLKRLQVDGQGARQTGQDTQEPFFAATHSQASRLDYRDTVVAPRYVEEENTRGEYVPLPYRSAVRSYFLRLPAN